METETMSTGTGTATTAGSESRAAGSTSEDRNAIDLFLRRVRASGPRTAFRWKEAGRWRESTWSELDQSAREIAAGLRGLGVEPGDRVAILAGTRPEWISADIGILMAGAATVPIYQSNLPHECEYILNDSGAKVVFAENPHQIEKLLGERDKLKNLVRVVYFDAQATLEKPDAKGRKQVSLEEVASESDRPWLSSLADLRAEGKKWLGEHGAELEASWQQIGPEQLFTIVYTSGTTGPPKGVVLTHSNIVWECQAMESILPLDQSDEQLLFLPMAHIFAKVLEWVCIAKGCRIAFAESIGQIKANLSEVQPSFMCAVPRVLEKFYIGILGNRNAAPPARQKIFDWAFGVGRQVSALKVRRQPVPLFLSIKNAIATKLVFSKIHTLLGGRMRFMVSGGAPLSKEIAEFFHAAGVLILEGWGLTETTAGTCVNTLERYAFGSVGAPVPGIELQIATDGEVLVRGGAVMKGYFNNPEATREAIDPEGWFHTGDIGVLEDGVLRITDRKKDIIVTAGGKNVAPQNLENALKATPYISQVMVHGDKRPYLVALITLNEENVIKWAKGEGLSASTLVELAADDRVRSLVQKYVNELNAREPSYSSLKKFAILPQDFSQDSGELTPTLKVKRKFTSEKFKDILDGFYSN